MSYLIRRVLAKPRLILDEMCRLYGKFACYLRRVLCKTRLIFPRINGPNVFFHKMKVIILGYNMKTSGCLASQLLRPAIINIMKLSYDVHVSFFSKIQLVVSYQCCVLIG